ncbi:MAG: hypothetical protein HQL77_05055 [Magnetococcales bacterium]|nr:hypothetical protein [Magnetococcales bacterium]
MSEMMGVAKEIPITLETPVLLDELADLGSLVHEANQFLDSMSSLMLRLDESVLDNQVQVVDTVDSREIARLKGDQMQDLSIKMQVLQNMLYDRCV